MTLAALTTSELISICTVTIFLISLSLSIWTLVQNTRILRVTQTARLHEAWWGADMMAAREGVFEVCRELARGGPGTVELIKYFRDPLNTPDPPGRRAFAQLMGFFCNLEVCMEERLVNELLITRLFGEAHYADYQPLIATVREAIVKARPNGAGMPQWLQMTVDLERRFTRHGAKFPSRAPAADAAFAPTPA